MPGDRLDADMLRLIAHVTSPAAEIQSALMVQAENATVIRCTATMLDVEVPLRVPAVALPNGPVPGSALVYEHEGLTGELLVWIRDGRLTGLEQAWYTGDPPESWPSPESVRVS